MLTLLAVFCPPLAVLITGSRADALGNLGRTMLLYVPGVVHALHEVDRHNTTQRYDAVMKALERT